MVLARAEFPALRRSGINPARPERRVDKKVPVLSYPRPIHRPLSGRGSSVELTRILITLSGVGVDVTIGVMCVTQPAARSAAASWVHSSH